MDCGKKYKKLNQIYKKKLNKLEKTFNIRLIWVGLLMLGLLLSAFFPDWHLGLPSLILFGFPFIYAVVKTQRLKKHIRELEHAQVFYRRQHLRQKGTYQNDARKKAKVNTIADDLDLLGPQSVFTMIDETIMHYSTQKFLDLLLNGDLSQKSILERQTRTKKWQRLTPQFIKWLVRTLAQIPEKNTFENTADFEDLLKAKKDFFGPFLFEIGLWIAFLAFIITLVVYCFISTPFALSVLAITWTIFFLFSMFSLKYNGGAFSHAQALEIHLPLQSTYFNGMYQIAQANKEDMSDLSQPLIKHNPQKYFANISSVVSFLGVQSNPLLLVIINSLLPWNAFFAKKLIKTKSQLNSIYEDIKRAMTQIEVQISLVFLYDFQTKTLPTFTKDVAIKTKNAYHPLIERSKAVKNSIFISNKSPVILITGSNMSGKSTFLRTIGINQLLALMGASVFADSFETFIGKTFTCIRVSDSLQQGSSYFYSEVVRIHNLLSEAKKQPSLFLIDEIFKGTNSRERLLGSQALIKALCNSKSLGFVTTHDIELTSAIKGLENWHFTDHTQNDILMFDYQIKKGAAKTTNALKVMKSVGLPVDAYL